MSFVQHIKCAFGFHEWRSYKNYDNNELIPIVFIKKKKNGNLKQAKGNRKDKKVYSCKVCKYCGYEEEVK